jgi:hypothetical protein
MKYERRSSHVGLSFVVFWCAKAHCTFAPSIIRSPAMHGIFAVVTRDRARLGIATATSKHKSGIPKITILAFCDIRAIRHLRIERDRLSLFEPSLRPAFALRSFFR